MFERDTVNYQKHCPGCFRRKDNHSVCPQCGYDEAASRSPLFLPHGAVLAGQYRVGKVLGRPGGFGITYLGWDIYLQQRVAIKEYLPPDIAARIPESQDITVHTPHDRKSFDHGREQFLREARIVAGLDHPNVVRVRGFFNANDTAYLVMDYYDGMSLDAYFGQVKPVLEPVIASSLMQMVLDGLDYVHRHGVIHRDIKPHNIYIAAIGKPIILDFGAARQAMADGGAKSISVVLTEGYAPLEQYQRHGTQGAWTDVYGVGATLYRMITGKPPMVVMDRIHHDSLEADDYHGLPEALKPVMQKALALKTEDRYQTAADFKLALAIAMGPASANPPISSPHDRGAALVRSMSTQAPATSPLPSELLHDTVRRHGSLPSTVENAVTRPAAALPAKPELPVVAPVIPAAGYRTSPATEPKRRSPRLLAVATVMAVAVAGAYWWEPSLAPAPVKPNAAATTATPQPVPLDPTLPLEALPELVEVPAGVRNGLEFGAMRIGRSELTVLQFRHFVERTGYRNPAWSTSDCDSAGGGGSWANPGYAQTDSHPVVCVDWEDARRYVAWLAEQTNRNFRLPTDREWEYAAAAGSSSRYWWGNAITETHAVCADCSRQSPSKPWIVASLGSNAWGLFGTASNVREWSCSTLPQGDCADASDAGTRVTRGGSWRDPTAALQTDFRALLEKSQRNTWTGFRIAEQLP